MHPIASRSSPSGFFLPTEGWVHASGGCKLKYEDDRDIVLAAEWADNPPKWAKVRIYVALYKAAGVAALCFGAGIGVEAVVRF